MKGRSRVATRALRILLIAGMLLTMLPSIAAAQVTQGIHGVVTSDSDPAVAIEGAIVYAENADSSLSASTTTGPGGSYELALPAGTYTIEFFADGHVPEEAPSVIIIENQLTHLNAALTPIVPVVSGTVTEADSGDPIEGVNVEALQFDAEEKDWVSRAHVFTDAQGAYTFTTANLPEGTYRIGTAQDTYAGVLYASRYYAGASSVTTVADAADVIVDRQDPLTGIDIQLTAPAVPPALSGRVICAAAQMPMPYTTVSIEGGPSTITDMNGVYSFAELEPGTYDVTFTRVGFLPETLSVTIESGVPQVLDVELVVDPETVGKIYGLVRDASNNEPLDQVEIIVNNGWTSVETTTDGSYGVVVPESTHQLVFVKAGYETSTAMVPVGPAEHVRFDVLLEPDLTPTTGTLRGVVHGPNHMPLAGVTVSIDNGSPSVVTNAQGEFFFADLPAEDHTVHFMADGYVTAHRDITIVAGQETELPTVVLEAEPTPPAAPVDRVSGDNRYTGAVAMARDAFDTSATAGTQWGDIRHIVIASGEDRAAADPLAAAGLSGAYDAPLFLVSRSGVPTAVKRAIDEIVDQAAGQVTIHIVGGPVSVPDARINEIRTYVNAGAKLTSERLLASGDRYDMAGAIAIRMAELLGEPEVVLLANGADPSKFFDALALSPIAAAQGYPILLVSRDDVPDGTLDALDEIAPDPGALDIVIGGGTATVSQEIEDIFEEVLGAGDDVVRWSGPTRYATALAIADGAVSRGWLSRDIVGAAAKLPDALSGGAAVGLEGGVLVLTESTRLTPATRDWLVTHAHDIDRVIVFGGSTSVPSSVVQAINASVAP